MLARIIAAPRVSTHHGAGALYAPAPIFFPPC